MQEVTVFSQRNLSLHRAPVQESICLHFGNKYLKPEDIKLWDLFAVFGSLRELVFLAAYILHSSLYTCKSLGALKLYEKILVDVPHTDISSVLVPSEGELMLLSNLLDERTLFDLQLEDDDDVSDAIVDSWNKLLITEEVKIFWEDLYLKDFECRGSGVEEEELGEEEEEQVEERRLEPMDREQQRGGLKEEIKKIMEMMMKMEESVKTIKKHVEAMNERLIIVEKELNSRPYMDFQDDYEPQNCFATGGTSDKGNAAEEAAVEKAAEEKAAAEKEPAEKAAVEKAATEKAAAEKAAVEKAAAEKATTEKNALREEGCRREGNHREECP